MPSSKSPEGTAAAPRVLPAWLSRIPIAHRGLHDLAAGVPENSAAAVMEAAKAGYGAEIDIQLSADGEVMVFHDDGLERLLGRPGLFGETSSESLAASLLLGTRETVPRLSGLLHRLAGATPLLIEIKAPFGRNFVPLLTTLLPLLDAYAGPFALQCFHPGVMAWLETHAPAIPRGQIASAPAEYRDRTPEQVAELMAELAAGTGTPDFLAYDIRHLPSDLTRRARDAGKPVLTWTVRTMAERALARAEASNIIFESCRP